MNGEPRSIGTSAHPMRVSNWHGSIPTYQNHLDGVLDYDAYFVIAVFQGRKPTTGYDIQIERITRLESKVTIQARFSEPKPDAEKAPEETSPYHLVQVQKTGTWGRSITFSLVVDNVVVASLSHHVP